MRSRRLRSIVLAGCALAGFAANSSAQFVASWTSAASGTWTNAANWSTNPVFPNNNSPAVGDTYDAVIDAIGPAYTVTLDSPITLNSLHMNSPSARLSHVSGTLQLLNSSTISSGTYGLSNGTILGPGTITISNGGVFEIPASGRGTIGTVVDNHGLAVLNNSTLTLANGTFNNHNTLVLGSGNRAVINSTGTSVLHNTGTIIASTLFTSIGEVTAPFINSGTIIAINGRTTFGSGTHNAGSTFAGDATLTLSGTQFLNGTLTVVGNVLHPQTLTGPGDLDVTGTLQWLSGTMSGTGATYVGPGARISQPLFTIPLPRVLSRVLNNEGTISINTGTLQMAGGTLNNLATGIIEYSSSAQFGNSGSTNLVNNVGTMQFGSGSSVIAFSPPLVNSGTILINTGGLNLGSGTHIGNAYIGGAGTVQFGGTVDGRLLLQPREVALGSVSGSGTLDLATAAAVSFASMSGTGVTNVLPGASIRGTGTLTLSRTLNNAGTMNLGQSLTFNNGTFNNQAGALTVFNARGLEAASGGGTNNAVSNAGTLLFTPSLTGGGVLAVPITNSGTIQALGSMQFSNGTVTHVAGSTLTGPGTISLGNITHRVNGTLTLAGENMVSAFSGTFAGAGNIDLSGKLDYIGGTISGTGALNILPGGTYNVLSSPGNITRAISNSGRINVGTNSSISGGTVTNLADGLIVIPATPQILFQSSRPLTNFGTILVNASGGSATLSSAGGFTNRGTLLAEGGTVNLGGSHFGGAVIAGSATINFTSVSIGLNATLAGSNMHLNGSMLGDGTLSVEEESRLTGTLHWNSGTIGQFVPQFPVALHVMPGAVLNAVGPGSRLLGRSLRNDGTINFIGGTTSWSAGSITNFAGGVINFTAIPNSAFSVFGPPTGSQFINQGLLNFSPAGTLSFLGFGNGTFTNSSGTIIVNNGSVGLAITKAEGNSYIGGAGTAALGVATLNGSLALDGKSVWNSMIPVNGTGSLLVNDQTFVQEGTFRNTGGIHIASDAEFFVGVGAFSPLAIATFPTNVQNAGVTSVSNGQVSISTSSGTGVFNNLPPGLLYLGESAVFTGNGTLNNAGRINISTGTFNTTLQINNTGTLAINAGSTALTGTIAQMQDSTLTGGNWIVGPVAQLHLAAGATISLNQANIELLSPFAHFPALNALQENSGTLSLRLGRSFTAAGSFTNSGVINIDNGGALFVNDVLFNSGTINGGVIQSGSSTLSGNSYIKTLRGGDVFVETSAAARVDYLDAAALSIASSADLTLGAGSIAHVIDILNIAPAHGTLSAGRLDLLCGRLVIDYTGSSPAGAVAQLLAAGFNNGDWLGRGITSSSILAGSNFAVGMIESAEIFSMGGTFAGVNVDNTALLLDRTLKGDANLDYTVNISDFAIVAAHFNAPTKWSKGDFNYDGVTNISDFALLAANFNQTLPMELPRQSIPEPAASAAAMLLTGLLSRRTRLPQD